MNLVSLTGATDIPQIGDVLFADAAFVPQSIDYTGSILAVALLPNGFGISEIDGGPVVGIDRGIFLTTGGGPGTENTETGFSVSLDEGGDARLDATAQAAFDGAGETNDAAIVTFTFDAESLGGNPSISFDLFFGSEEFPEFVDSSFVDIAAVYVNGVNYALFNNDPEQPLAIVGQSINTPGNFFDNGDGLYDTEYDGFSVLLSVVAPVQAGLNEVVIAIADTGDSVLDSGLFIGNVQGSAFDISGSFVNIQGTAGNDLINSNAAPELIELNTGEDTVTGTAGELDGDVINGFGDDDQIAVEGATFGIEDMTVTQGSAILDIDTDGDDVADSQVTLQGNFANATFSVANEGGDSLITATGVGGVQTGTEGNDTLTGTTGADTLNGLGGNDRLEGGDGDDELNGGDGDDGLLGQGGNDTLNGGDGNDNLSASDGDDVLNGGEGDDRMGGGLGNDLMNGGTGNDFMGGGFGDDRMGGGDDNDVVNGGAGDDSLEGGAGNDTMGASFGNDTVSGGAGNDDMGGGTGRDLITGGAGNDSVGGGEGDDSIEGGAGDDFLAGGGRNDFIDGGAGDDDINAGDGDDTMTGGTGADQFIFNSFKDGDIDVITDFEDGLDTFRMTGVDNAPGSGLAGKVAALNITDTDLGVSMSYDGHVIEVLGISASDLTLDDFTFL